MMNISLILLTYFVIIAAASPRHYTFATTTPPTPLLQSSLIHNAGAGAADHIFKNNTTNGTVSCNKGPKWQGASTWSEVFQNKISINALCYVFFLPFVIWQGCVRKSLFRRNRRVLRQTTGVSSLYFLLTASFILRAAWFTMEEANWCTLKTRDLNTHKLICPCFMILRVVNRLAMLFFFSAFSVIAIFWAEVVNQAKSAALQTATNGDDADEEEGGDSSGQGNGGPNTGSLLTGGSDSNGGQPVRDCCNPQTLFIMLNVWVYIIEAIVLYMESFGTYDKDTYDNIRDYNYICVSVFFAMLTVAMLCIGHSMHRLMKGVDRLILSKMIIIMVATSTCFTLRSIILSWEPLTKNRIPAHAWNIIDPTFLYTVPELLPSLVVLITMAPKGSRSEGDDNDYFEDDEDFDGDNDDVAMGEGGEEGCCCCFRGDSRERAHRQWLPTEDDMNGNKGRQESLLAFDVSRSVSSTDSINGGGGGGVINREAVQQRSRGWF